jgi:uncharacterized protein (DUF58 family)
MIKILSYLFSKKHFTAWEVLIGIFVILESYIEGWNPLLLFLIMFGLVFTGQVIGAVVVDYFEKKYS